MADLLDDIRGYIINSSLVTDSVVFLDAIPDSPDMAIAIYDYGGSSPLPQIASVQRNIQFVVRAKSNELAKKTIHELYKLFDTEDGILNLNADRWTMTRLLQPPFKFKVDTKNRVLYCFNTSITSDL